MPEKDFYAILGVKKDASQDELKAAFRRLAKKHHPDRHKGDKSAEDRFKEISAAYDVVGDPEKRRRYDEMRDAMAHGFTGFSEGPFAEGAYRGAGAFEDHFSNLRGGRPGWTDFFTDFFGRRAASSHAPIQGRDLHYTIEIPFDIALRGGKSALTFPRTEACSSCNGTGAASGSRAKDCPTCHGAGTYEEDQGGFAFTRVCPRCLGRGKVFDKPCPECRGSAEVRKRKRVEIKIPKGINDGAKIRVPGLGEPGEGGGPSGDLYILVKVKTPKGVERKGLDIYSDVEISVTQAMLGSKVDIDTVQGRVSAQVPAGTQPGATLRLKDKGIASSSGAVGDHLVRVHVRVPSRLSEQQRELVEALAKTGDV